MNEPSSVLSSALEALSQRFNLRVLKTLTLRTGWAGEVLGVQLEKTAQRFIVKTYQSSPQGKENLSLEWGSLKALYSAGFPVPEPLLFGSDSEGSFLVMQQIMGKNLWEVYQDASETEKSRHVKQFSELLYDLHSLDITLAAPLLQKSQSGSFVADELLTIAQQVQTHGQASLLPVVAWAVRESQNVSPALPCLLHRDYHPWNVLVDSQQRLKVIDWGLGIGDPRFDLAWTCSLMERSGFEHFGSAVFEFYRHKRADEIQDYRFFIVLATLRWSSNVLISMATGENLNKSRRDEFAKFVQPMLEKGFRRLQTITSVHFEVPRR